MEINLETTTLSEIDYSKLGGPGLSAKKVMDLPTFSVFDGHASSANAASAIAAKIEGIKIAKDDISEASSTTNDASGAERRSATSTDRNTLPPHDPQVGVSRLAETTATRDLFPSPQPISGSHVPTIDDRRTNHAHSSIAQNASVYYPHVGSSSQTPEGGASSAARGTHARSERSPAPVGNLFAGVPDGPREHDRNPSPPIDQKAGNFNGDTPTRFVHQSIDVIVAREDKEVFYSSTPKKHDEVGFVVVAVLYRKSCAIF